MTRFILLTAFGLLAIGVILAAVGCAPEPKPVQLHPVKWTLTSYYEYQEFTKNN